MPKQTYSIVRNDDRYPGTNKFPNLIILPHTTLKQAKFLAKYLSNYYPGQEYMFYVLGDEDN